MKTAAFIQARLDPTGLKDKVLLDLAGEPMLVRVVNRVRRAMRVDEVVVVTTIAPRDKEIEDLCHARGWLCFRGNEQDVLDRYYQAARAHQADVIVRVTSDCPLIEPVLIDEVIEKLEVQQCDYASNVGRRTYPRGLDVEAFTFAALETAWREDQDPALREHVTQFMARHPERFSITNLANDRDYSYLRWTVDTAEDFVLAEKIYTHFRRDDFTWQEVIAALAQNPEWLEINRGVAQRAVWTSGKRECLVVRADASTRIGAGHAMRCLALAQAWLENEGRAIFVMHETTPAFETLLRTAGVGLERLTSKALGAEDAAETAAVAARENAHWIVVDGYEFIPGYQAMLRECGAHVLCIDDDGCHHRYEADLVLSHHASADEALYADRDERTSLLLGPRYALLRRQFTEFDLPKRTIPSVAKKILVTFGGADPENVTQKAIEALTLVAATSLEVIVLISRNNPHREALAEAAGRAPFKIRIEQDASNMPELMTWADLAISGSGTTTLEQAFTGTPMLLLILASNQEAVAKAMDASGAARNLGWANALSAAGLADAIRQAIFDPAWRQQISQRGRQLVDGKGAARVARILQALPLQLRPVVQSDARLLFDWANDPEVRAASFYSKPIPWPDHERWLSRKLASPDAVLYIAETEAHQPVGVARFEVEGGTATISVSIAATFRGLGCGRLLIKEASRQIFERPDIKSIRALAKRDNDASAHAFLATGYREEENPEGPEVRIFTLATFHV